MLGEPGVVEYDAAVRAALRGFVFDERGRRRVFAGADDDDDADDGAGADPAARARRAAAAERAAAAAERGREASTNARACEPFSAAHFDLSRPRSTRAISYVDVSGDDLRASRGVAIARWHRREPEGLPDRLPSEDLPVGERCWVPPRWARPP